MTGRFSSAFPDYAQKDFDTLPVRLRSFWLEMSEGNVAAL
jgi:hypothetical protein